MPPGVFVSSTVGVRGAGTDCDSLLGRTDDCARRCLMRSTEDGAFVRFTEGDAFCGDDFVNSVPASVVGVGGVTNVVGVSKRLGGVSGKDCVLILLGLPRFVGVSGRVSFGSNCSWLFGCSAFSGSGISSG